MGCVTAQALASKFKLSGPTKALGGAERSGGGGESLTACPRPCSTGTRIDALLLFLNCLPLN